MKKPHRPRRGKKLVAAGSPRPWMSVLALMAAEARSDGGAGLQLLLNHAKFNERPHLSINKREAA
ncbi:MAG: hypothetical protein KF850_00965 [Labilithrix sp.]|nr:hypothetical protein [Labilithrix sp.]MBX3210581.1 hypothetical protein [Labilithrix sp.]